MLETFEKKEERNGDLEEEVDDERGAGRTTDPAAPALVDARSSGYLPFECAEKTATSKGSALYTRESLCF